MRLGCAVGPGVDTSVGIQGSEPISCNMGVQLSIDPHQTAAEARQTWQAGEACCA